MYRDIKGIQMAKTGIAGCVTLDGSIVDNKPLWDIITLSVNKEYDKILETEWLTKPWRPWVFSNHNTEKVFNCPDPTWPKWNTFSLFKLGNTYLFSFSSVINIAGLSVVSELLHAMKPYIKQPMLTSLVAGTEGARKLVKFRIDGSCVLREEIDTEVEVEHLDPFDIGVLALTKNSLPFELI